MGSLRGSQVYWVGHQQIQLACRTKQNDKQHHKYLLFCQDLIQEEQKRYFKLIILNYLYKIANMMNNSNSSY